MTSSHDDQDGTTRPYIQLAKDTQIGHYRIIGKIGEGGMGEVYLADDTELDRKVALKFLPPHLCQDADCRARFKREAQAAAKLDHPNIVAVHDVSEFQGRPFFSMQHVEGQSLKEVLSSETLQMDRILEIAFQICDGLRAAHEQGITHRDIKPSNILIDSHGRVKIVDFGLASVRGADKLTKTGSTMGTLYYMSPEQARGEDLDKRSDLFSFGVILYEMITGTLPFSGDHEPAILYSICYEEPEPLTKHKPDVPEALQTVISKLLAKDSTLRYQDAAEVIGDLQKLKQGSPIQVQKRHSVIRRIAIPAAVIAVVAIALILKPWRIEISSDGTAHAGINRIAVLYLQNLGSPDDEYLSYGITEDLIVDLTRIGSIGVAPMRSVMKFKDLREDLKKIADDLDVNLVLDGSVHKSGDVIRVSVQLINIATDVNLWADRWEEGFANLPQIKQALANGIGEALKIDTTRMKNAQVGVPEGQNARAYDYYLRAKYAFASRANEADVDAALGLYRKALELEPSFLAARCGVAEILEYKGDTTHAEVELFSVLSQARSRRLKADEQRALLGIAKSYELRFAAADMAVSFADSAAATARQLGDLEGELEALWVKRRVFEKHNKRDEALSLLERMLAILGELNDEEREAEALKFMGNAYLLKGEYAEGLTYFHQGLELARRQGKRDMEADLLHNIATAYFHSDHADSVVSYGQQACQIYAELGDKNAMAFEMNMLGEGYVMKGDYTSALEQFQRAASQYLAWGDDGGYHMAENGVGSCLMNIGQYDSAIAALDKCLRYYIGIRDSAQAALMYVYLGQCFFYQGDQVGARLDLMRALEYFNGLKDDLGLGYTCQIISEYSLLNDEYDSCLKYAELGTEKASAAGDRVSELLAAAYMWAAKAYIDGIWDCAQEFEKIRIELKELGLQECIVIVDRLYGKVMMEKGPSPADVSRGRETLEGALALAKELKLVHEIKWISQILQKHTPTP